MEFCSTFGKRVPSCFLYDLLYNVEKFGEVRFFFRILRIEARERFVSAIFYSEKFSLCRENKYFRN